MSTQERKYATARHPTIEALVHGLYRYKDRKQAVARFKNITEYFVLSKEQPTSTDEAPAALLWIKGFAITEEEAAAGFTGQFAEIRVVTLDSGMHSLTATRVDRPLAQHPQKKRSSAKHPNWGHPVMRAVKKAKVYKSIDEASAELELLHTEYPEVSIPGPGKLYIIIYEKREGNPRPTHKIALEIGAAKDGSGFIIEARDNEKADKKPAKAMKKPEPAAEIGGEAANPGYFAAMVTVKKTRRTKNAGRPVTGMKPSGDA